MKSIETKTSEYRMRFSNSEYSQRNMAINVYVLCKPSSNSRTKNENKKRGTKMVPLCLRCERHVPAAIFLPLLPAASPRLWLSCSLTYTLHITCTSIFFRSLTACVVLTFFVGTLKSIWPLFLLVSFNDSFGIMYVHYTMYTRLNVSI